MTCCSVVPVIKHCITPHWQQDSHYLFSLCHFTSLLNPSTWPLSLPLVFFLSSRLSFLSRPPICSALHPPLLSLSSISIWKQSCSLFSINTYPLLLLSHHVSSPTIFSPLPSSEARLWGGNHSVLWSKLLQHTQQGSQLPTQPYHSRTEPSLYSWPTRIYTNGGGGSGKAKQAGMTGLSALLFWGCFWLFNGIDRAN